MVREQDVRPGLNLWHFDSNDAPPPEDVQLITVEATYRDELGRQVVVAGGRRVFWLSLFATEAEAVTAANAAHRRQLRELGEETRRLDRLRANLDRREAEIPFGNERPQVAAT
ncbi:hypothetical protein [Zavarzinella formosa]|uniref:hypothetical protein n=1 Tax=Zavarzinella formosa TaxID=360055 RepID=UPI00030C38A2|nr:hypothetical protein [Zavarzinella formosa]